MMVRVAPLRGTEGAVRVQPARPTSRVNEAGEHRGHAVAPPHQVQKTPGVEQSEQPDGGACWSGHAPRGDLSVDPEEILIAERSSGHEAESIRKAFRPNDLKEETMQITPVSQPAPAAQPVEKAAAGSVAATTATKLIDASQVSAAIVQRANGDGDGRTGTAALNDGDAAASAAAASRRVDVHA